MHSRWRHAQTWRHRFPYSPTFVRIRVVFAKGQPKSVPYSKRWGILKFLNAPTAEWNARRVRSRFLIGSCAVLSAHAATLLACGAIMRCPAFATLRVSLVVSDCSKLKICLKYSLVKWVKKSTKVFYFFWYTFYGAIFGSLREYFGEYRKPKVPSDPDHPGRVRSRDTNSIGVSSFNQLL